MNVEVLQRAGAIAGSGEREHETKRDVGVERLERGEPAHERDRRSEIASGRRTLGERLERAMELTREVHALVLRPPLELDGAGQREAVEERTGVDGDRRVEIIACDRRLEVPEITRDSCAVEPQDRRPRDGGLGYDPAKRGEQLLEAVARPFGGALGPEQGEQALSRDALIATGGEERQRGEGGTPTSDTSYRSGLVIERQATEGGNSQHA
jgi:hypothetical protein